MKKLFKATTKIDGNGSFEILNKIPENTGAYGLTVEGTIEIVNLTVGESVSISVDQKEVFVANADGKHSFKFTTKPFPLHERTFEIGYSVTNAGTADVVLELIAH
ncbi:hypothetical protein FZC76_07785 [Sutcliffiella horikoshii]|uniref:Uncharacterized protein n=1 Tax=Sutcliffiella horikoshii TaxID=79883 RepID=A0A5D4SZF3_9BACI|nr:hypothetical protein [Sutcliffiella horikoshii]TYS68830.1 hypothetical protein FZC76_07785 [Sutcliffiella horikoshii]